MRDTHKYDWLPPDEPLEERQYIVAFVVLLVLVVADYALTR